MQHKRLLNRAIIVLLVVVPVLATVLFIAVPGSVKDRIGERYEITREAFEEGEWPHPQFDDGGRWGTGPRWMPGRHPRFHPGGFFVPLLVVGGVVFLVSARRYRGRHGDEPGQRGSAIDHLRERYAAGEITSEEYHERLRVLTEGRE